MRVQLTSNNVTARGKGDATEQAAPKEQSRILWSKCKEGNIENTHQVLSERERSTKRNSDMQINERLTC